jgi:phage-related protein
LLKIFISPNFILNGISSKDMKVVIGTTDRGILNDIGIEYVRDVKEENISIDYNPYYVEEFGTPKDIELSLFFYDEKKSRQLSLEEVDIEGIYNWLITDDFFPFISEDNPDLIYYFKTTQIQKVLTVKKEGFLRVTLKPFSNYAYKKVEIEEEVNGEARITINNPSNIDYYPMIKITNTGDEDTINSINGLIVTNVQYGERLVIDNLTKIVQNEDGKNRFNTCNRNWLKLNKKSDTTLVMNGKMKITIICEFPILR